MFKRARIKLTAWYLLIIMFVSFTFSFVIYRGINGELTQIQSYQTQRQQERDELEPVLAELLQRRQQLGLPVPDILKNFSAPDPALVSQARARLILILLFINGAIFIISGIFGYVLAGITLAPIAQMLVEQKDFVSNASHELRTPLTSLRSEIEVFMRDKKVSLGDAKDLLQSNLEEVGKMQKLTNYLLSLNRYQSGVANLSFTKVDLKDIAKEAVDKLLIVANGKNIKLVSKLQSVKINGNADSLVELAIILIDNAIKYSGSGKRIVISTKKVGLESILEVKDFGVGIKKTDLEHIFDKFYKSDQSREKFDGYGLGLSIAKSIVGLHGGQIKVDSKVGKGTTFKVIL